MYYTCRYLQPDNFSYKPPFVTFTPLLRNFLTGYRWGGFSDDSRDHTLFKNVKMIEGLFFSHKRRFLANSYSAIMKKTVPCPKLSMKSMDIVIIYNKISLKIISFAGLSKNNNIDKNSIEILSHFSHFIIIIFLPKYIESLQNLVCTSEMTQNTRVEDKFLNKHS